MKVEKYKLKLILTSMLIVPFILNAQYTDSIRIINDSGIGDIKIEQKIDKNQLNKYDNYKKEKTINPRIGRPYSRRYVVEDGLYIQLRKKARFSFRYNIVRFISVKAPFKAKTDKGVVLGNSSKKDVIEKYGKPDEESEFSLWYYLPDNNRLYFYFLDKENLDCVSEITLRKMPR